MAPWPVLAVIWCLAQPKGRALSDDRATPSPQGGRGGRVRLGRLILLLALTAVLIVVVLSVSLLGANVDNAFEPAPTRYLSGPTASEPVPTKTGSQDLRAFQAKCEEGAASWRAGQVDYPKDLIVTLGAATTYKAAVDVRDSPHPADEVIENFNGTTTSELVVVQCLLAARLVPVDDDIAVQTPEEGDWVYREFTPTGVVEWAWSVEVSTPASHQLRLDLRPAVRVAEGPTATVTQVSSFTTDVRVESTLLERASQWFETQWPKLAGIAVVLGTAVLGLKSFGTRLFSRKPSTGPRHGAAGRD